MLSCAASLMARLNVILSANLDLQLHVLGLIEKLEKVVDLVLHCVMVYKGRHCDQVSRLRLRLGVLNQQIVLGKNVVHVDFLRTVSQIKKAYLLSQVLD